MKSEVLDAIETAFHPAQTEEHLIERNGRVLGSVKVIGSETFNALDDLRRQRRLWDQLWTNLGERALNVGPIVMEPSRRE
jgi:hypothetical protein